MGDFLEKLLVVIGVFILSCVIIFLSFIIGEGLFNSVRGSNDQNRRIDIIETGNEYCIFYDKDTGVQYLRYINGGITPLYNKDSSLYIYEGKNN